MGKIFNYEGPFVQFLVKVFDIILVNLLWLGCSIPVITLGAATTAMYTVTFKVIRGENPYVIKTFFRAFAENFKQATAIWMLFLFVGILIGGNFYFLLYRLEFLYFLEKVILIVDVLLAFIWLMMFLHVFPLLSQFENSVKCTILNSYAIPLGNPVLCLGLLIMSILILIATVIYAPFVGFGVWAATMSFFMNKLFKKYTPAAPEEAPPEGNCEEISDAG